MTCVLNTVAVFGKAIEPVDVVLRYILKLKAHEAPVVVLDYTGRGAVVLNSGNQMSLLRHPVIWFNTADRRRPVALFHMGDSEHFALCSAACCGTCSGYPVVKLVTVR